MNDSLQSMINRGVPVITELICNTYFVNRVYYRI